MSGIAKLGQTPTFPLQEAEEFDPSSTLSAVLCSANDVPECKNEASSG
jgi:hypothetical protein